jgi:hypothetical protein
MPRHYVRCKTSPGLFSSDYIAEIPVLYGDRKRWECVVPRTEVETIDGEEFMRVTSIAQQEGGVLIEFNDEGHHVAHPVPIDAIKTIS